MLRYMGGKKQIGRHIAQEMLLWNSTKLGQEPFRTYFEPFLGMGGVMKHMMPHFEQCIGNDLNENVICLWRAVLEEGWHPTTEPISKERWKELKDQEEPSAEKSFAGFALGWGGAFFQGYSKNVGTRNWVQEGARSIEGSRHLFQGLTLHQKSFDQFQPTNCLIYCDPPYDKTRSFNEMSLFDSRHFWNTVDQWSTNPAGRNLVFVSEERAPSHWVCIWEKTGVNRSFGNMKKGEKENGKDYKKSSERLYVHQSWVGPSSTTSSVSFGSDAEEDTDEEENEKEEIE